MSDPNASSQSVQNPSPVGEAPASSEPNGDTFAKGDTYIPNRFSLGELAFCSLLGLGLLAYGGYCLSEGSLVLPSRAGGYALEGLLPTVLFFLGALFWALGLFSVVVDHFDTRNNEESYNRFGMVTHKAGLWLIGAGIILGALYQRFTT